MSGLLELDVTSLAAAAAHKAVVLVADSDGGCAESHCWFNGGHAVPLEEAEAAVQALGAYVASRFSSPGSEQLFIKARELGLHDLSAWETQPLWLHASYRIFAVTSHALAAELAGAQLRARDEEELRRRAGLASITAPPVSPQDAALIAASEMPPAAQPEPVVEAAPEPETVVEAAPAPEPETHDETELAAGDASPADNAADAPAAGEAPPAATSPSRRTGRR